MDIIAFNTTNDKIITSSVVIMILLAVYDYGTFRGGKHRDFKSSIVSIGVFGTFFGIYIGLKGFDTTDIRGSVPTLLEGLKLAFITSLWGMGISLVLTILQKIFTGASGVPEDENSLLESIDYKLSALGVVGKNAVSTVEQLKNFRMEVRDEQLKNRTFIEENFTKTNESLEKAIEALAHGATSEIVEALEKVIRDFNQNLTEQFGENFKELNQAVHKLVEWQNNYKIQVEQNQVLLSEISDSLNNTKDTLAEISSRNSEVIKVYQDLKDVLNTQEGQLSRSKQYMEAQEDLIENLSKTFKNLEESLNGISTRTEQFSSQIEGSITTQSETLKKLTQELSTELPRAMSELETNLTGLTKQFHKDYQLFLDKVADLLPK